MSYYPEPDGPIGDKVKVLLDLSNYNIKKKLDHAKVFDTSDLAAKNIFLISKLKLTSETLINWLIF